MLIYVAALAVDTSRPDLVIAGLAVREVDEQAMTAVAREQAAETTLVDSVISNGLITGLITVARDAEVASVASAIRCAEGLYLRLKVLLDFGLRPPGDWPSLFFRVRKSHLAEVRSGLELAATRYGEEKLTFVTADSPASAGGRIVDAFVRIVAASYAGKLVPEAVSRSTSTEGRPAGWLHYTTDRACPCLGCRAARLAVMPAGRPMPDSQPSPDVRIEDTDLPITLVRSLHARGVRTLEQVESMQDSDLRRCIGRSNVPLLRETVKRYRKENPR